MKFKSSYIKNQRINDLLISLDHDGDPERSYPVIRYTPDMYNTDTHYHIILSRPEAKRLHKFLSQYLEPRSKVKKYGEK